MQNIDWSINCRQQSSENRVGKVVFLVKCEQYAGGDAVTLVTTYSQIIVEQVHGSILLGQAGKGGWVWSFESRGQLRLKEAKKYEDKTDLSLLFKCM